MTAVETIAEKITFISRRIGLHPTDSPAYHRHVGALDVLLDMADVLFDQPAPTDPDDVASMGALRRAYDAADTFQQAR